MPKSRDTRASRKPDGEPKAAASESVFRLLREYTEAILIAAIFLRFANAFILQTFYIPSGSMEDTLLIGDHLFVNRFIYGESVASPLETLLPLRPVKHGDIVVFRSKEDPMIDVVKRCIGVPGDELQMREKVLYLNGERLDDRAFAQYKDPLAYRDLPAYSNQMRLRDNFGPLVVPEGHYFMMGDNRDHSLDSRYWGPLPGHLIKGRAEIIYWSYGGPMASENASGANRLAQMGRTALGFFTKTRWNRTFQLVR